MSNATFLTSNHRFLLQPDFWNFLRKTSFIWCKAQRNNQGKTPLHIAAEKGNFDIFKIIFEKIEDKNPGNNEGRTPLHFAAEFGHFDIFKIIFKNVEDNNPTDINGVKPKDLAIKNNHRKIHKMY